MLKLFSLLLAHRNCLPNSTTSPLPSFLPHPMLLLPREALVLSARVLLETRPALVLGESTKFSLCEIRRKALPAGRARVNRPDLSDLSRSPALAPLDRSARFIPTFVLRKLTYMTIGILWD